MPKMDNFLDVSLTLLNVLKLLNTPKDASLACWALFLEIKIPEKNMFEKKKENPDLHTGHFTSVVF